MPDDPTTMAAPSRLSTILKLAGAWAVVGIPALWGIGQVAAKALALFR